MCIHTCVLCDNIFDCLNSCRDENFVDLCGSCKTAAAMLLADQDEEREILEQFIQEEEDNAKL